MPTVRKDAGPDVTIRGYGRFEPGNTYEVDHETAEYLTGRGDFTLVKEDVTDVEYEDVDKEKEGEKSEAKADGLEGLDHEELKSRAEEIGIADDIDLRSKDSIIDGIRNHTED